MNCRAIGHSASTGGKQSERWRRVTRHDKGGKSARLKRCIRVVSEGSSGEREGVLYVQSGGESGREFRREATKKHCEENEG